MRRQKGSFSALNCRKFKIWAIFGQLLKINHKKTSTNSKPELFTELLYSNFYLIDAFFTVASTLNGFRNVIQSSLISLLETLATQDFDE